MCFEYDNLSSNACGKVISQYSEIFYYFYELPFSRFFLVKKYKFVTFSTCFYGFKEIQEIKDISITLK